MVYGLDQYLFVEKYHLLDLLRQVHRINQTWLSSSLCHVFKQLLKDV